MSSKSVVGVKILSV